MEPSFYAVIPATVRYHKDLPMGAKILYGEITALFDKDGYCWAETEYFADLYKCSKAQIGRWMAALARAGFIATIADDYKANSRKIWLQKF